VIVGTQLRVGTLILHNGKPHRVTKVHHVTPGKGRAHIQARLVSMESGSNAEVRYRTDEKIERVQLEEHSLQFSYRAGDEFHFMNTESFEMVSLEKDVLGDAPDYMTEGMVIEASYFEGRIVGVECPMFVELTVEDTSPHIKGATASASPKPATLETGKEVKVPPYIAPGDKIKVDTRTGEYIERVT
jgi:elongation factor P